MQSDCFVKNAPAGQASFTPTAKDTTLSPEKVGIGCARSASGTPFSAFDPSGRRLNLGEAANDLASCPEEGLAPTFDAEDLPFVSWGAASAKGQRMDMEDAHLGVEALNYTNNEDDSRGCSFFAVFDGHGGTEAAEYGRDHLLSLVLNNECFSAQPGLALNDAFLELDEQFYESVRHEIPPHSSGSTVLAALVVGQSLWVANAGDSRAVLSNRGKALELTVDHRPGLRKEEARVVERGGFFKDGYLGGHLGVTRGIGDYHLESLKQLPIVKASSKGPLTAEPDIFSFTLNSDHEFIVMACDGLWDLWPSQRVVEIARQNLQHNDNDPQICAQHLVNESIANHAFDNVTVIVICLSKNAPPKRDLGDLKRSVSQNGINSLRNALNAATARPAK